MSLVAGALTSFLHLASAQTAEADCLSVFFHGFPGVISRQNQDAAAEAARTTKCDSVVFFFEGLKEETAGRFSFEKSLQNAAQFVEQIPALIPSRKYKHIRLVGHSFGGFVSLALLPMLSKPSIIDRILLLAPLTEFPDAPSAEKLLEATIPEYPTILYPSQLNSLVLEAGRLHKAYPRAKLVEISKNFDIQIIHGREDEEIPVSGSVEFARLHPHAKLTIIENNHNLQKDRGAVCRRIVEALL